MIETTARIGNDGILRLEIPTEQRNQDVKIALVIESLQIVAPVKAVAPSISTRGNFEDLVATLLPKPPSNERLVSVAETGI